MMDDWTMTSWGWGWMSVMMIIGVLLIATVVVVVIRSTASNNKETGSDDALDILDRRLARGEINEDEYRRRREALRESRS